MGSTRSDYVINDVDGYLGLYWIQNSNEQLVDSCAAKSPLMSGSITGYQGRHDHLSPLFSST